MHRLTCARQLSLLSRLSHQLSSLMLAKPATSLATKRKPVSWQQTISSAEKLVHCKGGSVINPKQLLGSDLTLLTENIRRLLGSGHPVLDTISSYYFAKSGKHIRPLIVLLMSQATSSLPRTTRQVEDLDAPISPSHHHPVTFEPSPQATSILPCQRRLAEITEMIHTASLLHDDVIDHSPTRRGMPSANAEFGNKMAVLAGDFLLARASVALARLRHVEVVELLATVIANLVEGEFMQLKNKKRDAFEYYLDKTYFKTASLIAKSCQASAILGGHDRQVSDLAYEYGRNIGVAFQVYSLSVSVSTRSSWWMMYWISL